MASALPPSCTSLFIKDCGHELYKPDSPVAYNHINPFSLYVEDFPASSGWKASETWIEEEMKEAHTLIKEHVAECGEEHVEAGLPFKEWIKMMKRGYKHTVFERYHLFPWTNLKRRAGSS